VCSVEKRLSSLQLLTKAPHLGRVCLAQAINSFGSSIAPIALAFAALDGGSDVARLALVLFASALGPAIVTLFGGVAADRGDRARVIIGSRLTGGAIQTVTGVVVLSGVASPRLLAVFGFAISAVSAYALPASRALVRDLVDPEDIQRGTGLAAVCTNTARLLGPGFAAIALLRVSNGALLLADAATFFVSAALMARVKLRPLPARAESTLKVLRDGIVFSIARPWLWTTSVCGMLISGAWMAGFQLLGPVRSAEVYGGASFWAWCGTAYAAGLIIGGLLSLHLEPRDRILSSVIASTALALPLIAFGVQAPTVVILAAIAAASVSAALAMTWWAAGLASAVDRTMLARVFAFNSALELIGIPIAYASVWFAADAAGSRTLEVVMFSVVVVISAANAAVLALRSPLRRRTYSQTDNLSAQSALRG
jgi:MFS family permease